MYLYMSLNIFRVMKSRIMYWAGHIARMWDERSAYILLWGNTKEITIGRPGRSWENNNEMEHKGAELGTGNGFWWYRSGTGCGRL